MSPATKVSGIEPPVLNVSVPIWPLRSGRLPKVMAIVGTVPSGHSGSTSIANSLVVGNVVVVLRRSSSAQWWSWWSQPSSSAR